MKVENKGLKFLKHMNMSFFRIKNLELEDIESAIMLMGIFFLNVLLLFFGF